MLRIVLASGAFPITSMKRTKDVVESSLTGDPLQDLAPVLKSGKRSFDAP